MLIALGFKLSFAIRYLEPEQYLQFVICIHVNSLKEPKRMNNFLLVPASSQY